MHTTARKRRELHALTKGHIWMFTEKPPKMLPALPEGAVWNGIGALTDDGWEWLFLFNTPPITEPQKKSRDYYDRSKGPKLYPRYTVRHIKTLLALPEHSRRLLPLDYPFDKEESFVYKYPSGDPNLEEYYNHKGDWAYRKSYFYPPFDKCQGLVSDFMQLWAKQRQCITELMPHIGWIFEHVSKMDPDEFNAAFEAWKAKRMHETDELDEIAERNAEQEAEDKLETLKHKVEAVDDAKRIQAAVVDSNASSSATDVVETDTPSGNAAQSTSTDNACPVVFRAQIVKKINPVLTAHQQRVSYPFDNESVRTEMKKLRAKGRVMNKRLTRKFLWKRQDLIPSYLRSVCKTAADLPLCHIFSTAFGGIDHVANLFLAPKPVNDHFGKYMSKEWEAYVGKRAFEEALRWQLNTSRLSPKALRKQLLTYDFLKALDADSRVNVKPDPLQQTDDNREEYSSASSSDSSEANTSKPLARKRSRSAPRPTKQEKKAKADDDWGHLLGGFNDKSDDEA